jgi:non-heme chloroperoxidase
MPTKALRMDGTRGLAVGESVRSSDTTEIFLRRYGDRDARPVVFLHGLGMDGLVWQEQAERLSARHQVVTVDLRGHGRSQAPVDNSYSNAGQWADDIHAVLETLPLPAVIVAWSYAGMVAGDYVRRYGPDRLAGIYLVAPLRKIGTPDSVDLLDPGFLALVPGLLSGELGDSVTATEAFIDLVTARPLGERQRLERLGAALRVPAAVRAAMLSREDDNDDVWEELAVPIGLAFGGRDRITKPASARGLAEITSPTQVDEHPDAGHAPFLDDADVFAANLERFVKST